MIAVILLAGSLAACDRGPRLAPLPADAVILAFGDSLTAGQGVSPEQSYPAVLARLSGRRVVNAGVPGEVTADGLARLPDVLDETRPQLLLLLHGGNDILRNLDPVQAAGNLSAMVRQARARGIGVVLIGVPEKRLFSDSSPIYQALAEREALVFEGEIIAELVRSPAMKSDAVHFNASGYERLAQTLHALLNKAGAW